jgi:hypothetical protein
MAVERANKTDQMADIVPLLELSCLAAELVQSVRQTLPVSVGIVARLRVGRPRNQGSILSKGKEITLLYIQIGYGQSN